MSDMVAGRELDAEIAKLMGCKPVLSTLKEERERDPAGACWCGPPPGGGVMGCGGPHSAANFGRGVREVAPFSISIAAAFGVWDKLIADGWYPDLKTTYDHVRKGLIYVCELHRASDDGRYDHFVATADTAPLAICKAALEAASIPLTAPEE